MAAPTLDIMTVSAHDVADELRRRLPGLGVVKLHKLLYYAQGWHLTWIGEPMFREPIKAWANGPVVADLWADEKHDRGRPPPAELTGDHLATIRYVVDRYGPFTGKDLVRLTHAEDPWREASETDDKQSEPDPGITQDALRNWFRRDDEYRDLVAKRERLRQRTDFYSFAARPMTPELNAAVQRALSGERVQDARPG